MRITSEDSAVFFSFVANTGMYYDKRSVPIKDRLRVNNRIRAREVRLIDEEGTQVGIIPIREALQTAEERGLDLVEVAPNANPPVCRVMDYGKYRYEQSKKEREARKNQRQSEMKEVRLRPKTDDHDLSVKSKQARRFLQSGDKVKFTVRFRGREMAHPDIGREMLDQISDSLRDIAVVEQKQAMEGRAVSLVLAPNPKALKALQQAQRKQAQADQQARKQAQAEKAGDAGSENGTDVEADEDLDEDEDEE